VPPEDDRSQLRYILTGVASRRHAPTSEQTIQRDTANPLYLALAAEELRLFGEFGGLADFIAHLPTDVPGMFQMVLARLEQDHEREFVAHALGLVATGRHGLLEGELLELLARGGEPALMARGWRGATPRCPIREMTRPGSAGLLQMIGSMAAGNLAGSTFGALPR
jgi:hypothetical protein